MSLFLPINGGGEADWMSSFNSSTSGKRILVQMSWISLGQEGLGCHCPEASFALSCKCSASWETELGYPLGPTPHQDGSDTRSALH